MLRTEIKEDGLIETKESGKLNGVVKHNVDDLSRLSNWSAVPDLILTIVPTAILVWTGSLQGTQNEINTR